MRHRPTFRPGDDQQVGGQQAEAQEGSQEAEEDGQQEDDELDTLLNQYEAEAAAQTQDVLQKVAKKGSKGKPGALQAREEALATPIATDNKGFQLLSKMGYKPGQGIGKSVIGQVEPLKPEVRDKRGGLGVLEGQKRKRQQQQEQWEADRAKQAKVQAEASAQYQDQGRDAYYKRRVLVQMREAWKVCEQLECAALGRGEAGVEPAGHVPSECGGTQPPPPSQRTVELLQQLPDLWVAAEGTETGDQVAAEESEDGDESAAARQHEPSEQLQVLLRFLRQEYKYCLYCGCAYNDADDLLQNCPGPAEDDH